jgi:hypothetical protein
MKLRNLKDGYFCDEILVESSRAAILEVPVQVGFIIETL